MGSVSDWFGLEFPATFPAFAIDLPGHGGASEDITQFADFDLVVDEIYRTVQDAGMEKIRLIGYSMGGRIAIAVAHRYPDLVETLVLESASTGISNAADRLARLELDQARSELLIAQPERFIRSWFDAPIFDSLRTHPDLADRLIANRLRGPADAWARAVIAFSPGNQLDFEPWLSEYRGKTGMITGSLDHIFTEQAAALHRKNKRIRHITVLKAGHNVHLEQPDMYLAALSELLGW